MSLPASGSSTAAATSTPSVVHSSYNEARITPMTTPSQLVLDAGVEVAPAQHCRSATSTTGVRWSTPSTSTNRTGIWTVIGRSVVETTVPDAPGVRIWTWAELHGDAGPRRLRRVAGPDRAGAGRPRVCRTSPHDLERRTTRRRPPARPRSTGCATSSTYVAGTTGVHTSAIEAWDGGQGVCQDFAHLALAVVRAMGLPARYCSGYLHPDPRCRLGATLEGQSHAWIEVVDRATGRRSTPPSGRPIGEHHVLVARGRDYADVSPSRASSTAARPASLDVSVHLTRLG